jgi:AraC-like DNA-binding protein
LISFFNKEQFRLVFILLNLLFVNCYFYFVFEAENLFIGAILSINTIPVFALYGPLVFIYTKGVISNKLKFETSIFKHFTFFFILFILSIPYLNTSWKYKLSNLVLLREQAELSLNLKSFSSFTNLQMAFILTIFNFCYLIFSFFRFQKIKDIKAYNHFTRLYWLSIFLKINLFILGVLSLSLIIKTITSIDNNTFDFRIFISFLTIGICFMFFLFPKVIYGNYKNHLITSGESTLISQKLIEDEIFFFSEKLRIMVEDREYLKSNFDKSYILHKTDVTNQFFVFYFNTHLKSTNFITWRNNNRIEYAITLISDGYLQNHTIESLSNLVGFKSRNTFTRVFKSYTGKLPSDI